MDDATRRVARELGERLAAIESQLEHLRTVGRSPQLTQSSIDDGQLETRDANGNTTSTWGSQPDGTTATVYMPGPVPPAPSTPEVFPLGAGVGVYWAGSFASDATRPADFRYVEVHASEVGGYAPDATTKRTTILDTEGDGGDVVLPTTVPVYVVLVAVSTSGVRSAPSTQVTATPGLVVAQDILDGIVTETKIANDAVTAAKIAAAAVGTSEIAGNAVDLSKLADGSVSAAKLIAGAVGSTQLANGAVGTSKLADGSVSGAKLIAGAVGSTALANDAVDASKLADGSVDSGALQALAVIAGKVAANAIGADQIIANAIVAGKIAANAVGTDQLAANSVVAGKVAANAIDAAQIVAGAIQATKIAAGAVLADKIAAGAVTTDKLDALAVVAGKIAANAIVAGNIATGAVTAGTIAANAVTAEKLAATIILASTIFAGDPAAAHTEYGPNGLVQYDDSAQPTVSIGATPGGSTYFNVQGHATVTRRNRCPNPKLANDSTGWSIFQATGSRVAGTAFGTAYAWRATDNGASTNRSDISHVSIPVTRDEEITASLYMRASFAGSFRLGFNWRNGAGTIINATPDYGTAVAVDGSSVYRLSFTGRPPTFASFVDVVLTVNADMAASSWFEATRCLVESGNTVAEYFDGDSTVGATVNILPNPGFSTDVMGWQADGCTLTRTTATFRTSPAAAAVAPTGTSAGAHTIKTGPLLPVSEAQPVTASAWVRCATAVSTRVEVAWFDPNGASVAANTAGATVAIAASGSPVWTQATLSTTAPAGATQARLLLITTFTGAAPSYTVDDFTFAAGTPAAWDGTTGASTSTVQTQTVDSVSLASLDSGGALSVRSLAVTDPDPTFGGSTLSARVDRGPGRVVTYSQILGNGQNTPSTSTEIGFAEISFFAQAGRLYRIMSTPIIARAANQALFVRYTVDGSTPTTSSPTLAAVPIATGKVGQVAVLAPFGQAQVRLLLTNYIYSGTGSTLQAVAADIGFVAWVEDAGPDLGALASGAKQYTTNYTCTWTRAFDKNGIRADNDLVQGQSVDSSSGMNRSMIGMPDAKIRSDLSGATVQSVSVYLYSYYWWNNDGGYLCIGTHNQSTAPAAYSSVATGLYVQKMAKPEGRWIPLDIAVANALRDNTAKGLVLDSQYKGTNNRYTGKCRAYGQDGQPVLSITYTK